MANDTFKLAGSYTAIPATGAPSLISQVEAPIDEQMSLAHKYVDRIDLSTDSPVAVDFGGVTNANVVVLKATGGKVKAAFTSSDGSAQAVPFDEVLIIITGKNGSTPITAITLTRQTGIASTVDVFLGEKA